jgi:hypothetical protein
MIVVGALGGVAANIVLFIMILAILSSLPGLEALILFFVAGQVTGNILLIRHWMRSESTRGYGIGLLIALGLWLGLPLIGILLLISALGGVG